MVIPRGDYHSCRRSLLQAISQLETLLRGDTDYVPPYEGEKRDENNSDDTASEFKLR